MSDTPTQTTRIDDELQTHVTRAFDFEEAPETFEAFWEQMLETFADGLGRDLSLADLCTTDDSPHRATVDGRTQSYQCVADAFILGTALDDQVTVRTESPVSGTDLVVEFDEDGVVAAPEGAVLSYGVERTVSAPDGPVTPAKMYGRFCPYNEAFASREEYERWAADNPGVVSTAHPLEEALALQARVVPTVEGQPFDTDQSAGGCGDGCGCGGA